MSNVVNQAGFGDYGQTIDAISGGVLFGRCCVLGGATFSTGNRHGFNNSLKINHMTAAKPQLHGDAKTSAFDIITVS